MNQLEQIRSFVQLVDSGSATAAADVRGVAVSAISRRLKELEQRLGVQLLQRTTRKMTLTAEGRQYYERCVRILADLAEAEDDVASRGQALRGTLSIATPVSFGVDHLSPAISAFMHAHPQLTIKLDMNDRQIDLIEEGVDVAIRIGELKDSSLHAKKIARFCHVVCAAPSYFERHGVPKTPTDLECMDGLCYGNLVDPSMWRYKDGNRWGEVRVKPKLVATNGEALREAAIAGLGVICEPSFIVHRALESGQLQPVLTNYQWYNMAVYAVYPPTRHLSSRARALIDFLTARFGPEPYWQKCLLSSGNRS